MANRRPSAKNSMKDLRQEFERVFGIAFLTLPLPEANVTNRERLPNRAGFRAGCNEKIVRPYSGPVTAGGHEQRTDSAGGRGAVPPEHLRWSRLPRSQSAVIVHVSTQHLRGAGHHRAGRPRDNLPAQHLRRSGLSVGGLRVPLRPDDLRSPRG